MSTNLYLGDGVRDLDGFTSEPFSDRSGDRMKFNGMTVSEDKGRLYVFWSKNTTIPEVLEGLVEEISCYETIPQMGHRESGIYRHKNAECELVSGDDGNARRSKPVYRLEITSECMEDLQELIHKIKVGTIWPEESYEGPQSGKSRVQLEEELARVTLEAKISDSLNTRLTEEKVSICECYEQVCEEKKALREQLIHFVDKLENLPGLMPIFRWIVVKGINSILNSTR